MAVQLHAAAAGPRDQASREIKQLRARPAAEREETLGGHTVTRVSWAINCGLLLGVIAGGLGFILPIWLTPEANQGPLLGIFVTGPLGCVLGAILGAIFAESLEARFSRRRQ